MRPSCPYKPQRFQTLRHRQFLSNVQENKRLIHLVFTEIFLSYGAQKFLYWGLTTEISAKSRWINLKCWSVWRYDKNISSICTFIRKVSYCCCFVMSVLFETWGSFWKVAKSNEIFPYLNAFLIQRLLWSIAIPAMLRIISDRSRYHAAFPESKNGGGWYFIKKCHRQGGRSSYGYARSRANI